MPDSPFIKDVPAAQALAAWRAAREAAGCPERLPAVTVPVMVWLAWFVTPPAEVMATVGATLSSV